jgi:tripartite-type tricarboxylate transporter receptor subunit TctC
MLNIISRSTATLLAVLLLLPRNAHADDVASFYKTHDLTLLIGTSSGGGYDLAARFLARYLPEHIPSHPRIVIENMAGAGGIVAGNYLSTSAPRDGSLIASVLNNVPFEPLFGTKASTYDPIKFNWIGSTNPETAFLITWHFACTVIGRCPEARNFGRHVGHRVGADILCSTTQ